MRRTIYWSIIWALLLCIPLVALAQKECPDCDKAKLTSPLDPNWKQFRPPPLAPGELPDCHRVQFGKQDCGDCHMKETPDMYKQWIGSKHGINSVKCGTCHGDVVNYRAMPDRMVCIGCHSMQVKNMPAQANVTNCAYCHKSHWFTIHKIDKYKQFAPDRETPFKVPGF
jgi:hypothetical protein